MSHTKALDEDVHITSELLVRQIDKKTIQIRVGDEGWHKEAANLSKTEAKELASLLSEFAEERREAGKPIPDYGDLYTREEWGKNGGGDGSCYPADLQRYYPEISMSKRTEKHTHVIFFAK